MLEFVFFSIISAFIIALSVLISVDSRKAGISQKVIFLLLLTGCIFFILKAYYLTFIFLFLLLIKILIYTLSGFTAEKAEENIKNFHPQKVKALFISLIFFAILIIPIFFTSSNVSELGNNTTSHQSNPRIDNPQTMNSVEPKPNNQSDYNLVWFSLLVIILIILFTVVLQLKIIKTRSR